MPLAVLKRGGADTGVGRRNLPGKFVNQREAPNLCNFSDSRKAGRNECQKLKICTVLLTSRYTKIETNTSTKTIHPLNRQAALFWWIFSLSATLAS